MAEKVTKKIIRNDNYGDKIIANKVSKKTVSNPLATAVWLVDNTFLTFFQIAEFCQLHDMEVTAIANKTFAENILPISPIGVYLNQAEIDRCQKDENAKLQIIDFAKYDELEIPKIKTKKYTPLLQRRSKADAILWIITFAPEVSNRQIVKLLGTTENTVEAIRNRSHRSISDLTPKDPVIVGLCKQRDLDNAIKIAKEKAQASNNS